MQANYAATVGFFDGVHVGHRFLIEQLKSEAALMGLKSRIITFSIHPRKVLHDSFQPQLLTSLEEKLELLKATGVDSVEVLDFTPEMAKLTALEFIRDTLAGEMGVRLLLVGHDHRFGHNREDGFNEYEGYGRQTGVNVIRAERYFTEKQKHISSSTIRNFLKAGQLNEASDLLGYNYAFTGEVVSGYQVGRKIGFPTANLKVVPEDKLIPGIGVYAVNVEWNGLTLPSMMNIGYRPTIDNTLRLSLEVHIFDFNQDIYHQHLKVRFLYKIRDEKKFASLDELILQLEQDKAFVLQRM
ncbi:MAG: riboflavin biosynthesis protein RibF [Paludibacter sp.]|nr:riboflavin biosynthesis protein RibF [Paludibacter sp.]